MPNSATQMAGLQSGEADWVEQPLMDLVPVPRRSNGVAVAVAKTAGLLRFLRFNQLFPPFDNAAIRRVALKAVDQTEYCRR